MLGSLQKNLFLASELHVPKQTLEKFNQLTLSMVENGWYKFVEMMDTFWYDIRSKGENFRHRHQLDFKPITLEDFHYPLIIYLCLMGCYFLIFVLEIIWVKIRGPWNQCFNRCWENFLCRKIKNPFRK